MVCTGLRLNKKSDVNYWYNLIVTFGAKNAFVKFLRDPTVPGSLLEILPKAIYFSAFARDFCSIAFFKIRHFKTCKKSVFYYPNINTI